MDDRVAELRRAFDDAFARPARTRADAGERLLLVRAGAQHLALPVAALAGVERGVPVVALPGAPRALRGIAGVHGRLLPVFALAGLIGAGNEAGDWLAVIAADPPVAVSFDELAGLVEVAALEPAGPAAPRHARGTHRAGDRVYWVVDVSVLLEGASA